MSTYQPVLQPPVPREEHSRCRRPGRAQPDLTLATCADGGAGPDSPHYKWVALSNTTLGVLMATMNSSIVLISLPAITVPRRPLRLRRSPIRWASS
ncbi:MAG: hypothetical protein ACRDQU_19390 [Pseudonocardiaceae bacterium]